MVGKSWSTMRWRSAADDTALSGAQTRQEHNLKCEIHTRAVKEQAGVCGKVPHHNHLAGAIEATELHMLDQHVLAELSQKASSGQRGMCLHWKNKLHGLTWLTILLFIFLRAHAEEIYSVHVVPFWGVMFSGFVYKHFVVNVLIILYLKMHKTHFKPNDKKVMPTPKTNKKSHPSAKVKLSNQNIPFIKSETFYFYFLHLLLFSFRKPF